MSDAYQRLQQAIAGQQLPLALVELDNFDDNLRTLLAAAGKKSLRIATKSIRVTHLLRAALGAGGRGLMTFAARETAALAKDGFADLLLAYPTVSPTDIAALAGCAEALTGVAVDCEEHVAALEAADAKLPCVIDVDASYKPLGLHLGVRRSPLREAAAVAKLAERIARSPRVRFAGLMAYEAQIAGLGDGSAAVRAMKALSRPDVAKLRREALAAVRARGIACPLFNGAGTGSLRSAAAEEPLTELTAGSGLLCGHLFDHYLDLRLRPALYFALQIARKPAAGLVTCNGGGIVASGECATDRLPIPALPEGLQLLPHEGAGEVQTPLQLPRGLDLPLGAPVFFRPAKSGEPLERFDEVLLVRCGKIEARAKTYRGLGLGAL